MRYILAILSFFWFANSASSQKTITINGQLNGVEEGTKIWLMKQEGNVGTGVSKDSVVNGGFHIHYTPENEGVEQYALMADGKGFPSMSLKLWAKAGCTITVEGNDKLIYTWNVKSDLSEQSEWLDFINASKRSWTDYQQLSIQRGKLVDQYRFGNPTKEEAIILKKGMDSLDSLSKICDNSIQKNNLALLQKGAMTPTRLELLKNIANNIKWNGTEAFRPAVEKLYSGLTADMKSSPCGQEIALVLHPPKVIRAGQPMYDTLLKDIQGNTYHLADFKGRYILLDFWSFGCGPCHASIPEMQEIHEKLKDSLTIVSLSSDNKKIWEQATKAFKMTWHNLSDGNENRGIYAQYGVEGIPNYVLITPDGRVKATWTGYGPGSLKEKIKGLTGLALSGETKNSHL